VNLPVTKVPRGTRNKAKTLGLQHLQPPDVCAGSGPPGGGGVPRPLVSRLINHTQLDTRTPSMTPLKE